jgi:hypothetical protein
MSVLRNSSLWDAETIRSKGLGTVRPRRLREIASPSNVTLPAVIWSSLAQYVTDAGNRTHDSNGTSWLALTASLPPDTNRSAPFQMQLMLECLDENNIARYINSNQVRQQLLSKWLKHGLVELS